MYGPTFRLHSPALYYLVSIALNYGIVGTLIGVVLHKYALVKRVPMKYRSPVLFGLGCGLIVLTLAARVLAATVEGGGAGFVVANLSIFLVYPALIMLAVAAVKFFIGVGKGVGQPGN